jgi:acyl dehydratase
VINPPENSWDYDAVEPGQSGRAVVVTVTKEDISWYALIAQNISSRFTPIGDCQQWPSVAMPTMILTYAPLLREEIAEANGYVALEWSTTARRPTPFAKCEIRWSRGVLAGDTITSNRRVLEKYVRRGSRFVTFRVEATNQRGEEVAQYDYTCIFDYAQGRKAVPEEPGKAQPSPPTDTRPRFSWESVREVGDQLTPLNIQASQENINEKDAFRLAGKHNPININADADFARQSIFGGTVVSGPAAMSYVDQMLQQSFTMGSFHGGRLLLRPIEPFRPGDTVTFHGELTSRGGLIITKGGDSRRVVQCRITGINQRGGLVNLSDATLILKGLEAEY